MEIDIRGQVPSCMVLTAKQQGSVLNRFLPEPARFLGAYPYHNSMKRGLGSPNMNENMKHKIQSKGGKMSPQNFANNPTLAQIAGRKGGQARSKKYIENQQATTSELLEW